MNEMQNVQYQMVNQAPLDVNQTQDVLSHGTTDSSSDKVVSPLEIESSSCFQELQSNVGWDDDRNMIENFVKNVKHEFDVVRGRDENHTRNCVQDNKLEMPTSFLNVVTIFSKILG